MNKTAFILGTLITSTVLIAGCTNNHHTVKKENDFWQRSEPTSALYLRGPKAQHQLNKDIAACVAEVRELVRLGSIRKATPPSNINMSPDLRQGWEAPTHDGPLYTEYRDFHDFEGCMEYKGWTRARYVSPEIYDNALRNYNRTILGKSYDMDLDAEEDNSGFVKMNEK